jgi:hypothetical protein
MKTIYYLGLVVFLLLSPSLIAQDSKEELSQQAANPHENLHPGSKLAADTDFWVKPELPVYRLREGRDQGRIAWNDGPGNPDAGVRNIENPNFSYIFAFNDT